MYVWWGRRYPLPAFACPWTSFACPWTSFACPWTRPPCHVSRLLWLDPVWVASLSSQRLFPSDLVSGTACCGVSTPIKLNKAWRTFKKCARDWSRSIAFLQISVAACVLVVSVVSMIVYRELVLEPRDCRITTRTFYMFSAYIHIYIFIYKYINIYTCIYICICIYIHIYI